jgi:hypothetical protein
MGWRADQAYERDERAAFRRLPLSDRVWSYLPTVIVSAVLIGLFTAPWWR